jgi:translation initiation factor IF-3
MSSYDALRLARERSLDLVEVAPTADPPVCRLLDYGKFMYEQQKKQREAKKHQRNSELKEVRFRPKIDDHDIDFKTKQALRFLKEGDKVKMTVVFRGREITHPEIGRKVLDQVLTHIEGLAVVEKPAALEGRNMTLILAPLPQKPGSNRPAAAAAAAPAPATPVQA